MFSTLAFRRYSGAQSTRLTAVAAALATMLCLALAPAPFALAQWRTFQDAEVCVTGTGNTSLDIAVCGRALGSEGLSELERASMHTARGTALRESGKLSAAVTDFDAALWLNPASANAFHERALALDVSGHHQQALEDFRHAIALSPRFAAAYKSRALAHFYAGTLPCAGFDLDTAATLSPDDADIYTFRGFVHYLAGRYRDAADDFERAHALALPYAYLPIWRYLARAGSGEAGRSVLVEARAQLPPDEWPRPLIEAYLGERNPGSLVVPLERDASPGARRRLAASHYYLSALQRLNGGPEQALSHLEKSVALSEQRMPERVLAEHELAATTGMRSTRPPGEC